MYHPSNYNGTLLTCGHQQAMTEWQYIWVKMIKDYTGWDSGMWPLAIINRVVALQGFLIRKCMGVLPEQRKVAIITK